MWTRIHLIISGELAAGTPVLCAAFLMWIELNAEAFQWENVGMIRNGIGVCIDVCNGGSMVGVE